MDQRRYSKADVHQDATWTIKGNLGCKTIGFSEFLQSIDMPKHLLGGMRDGDVVMLVLCPLLGKVRGKGWVPM